MAESRGMIADCGRGIFFLNHSTPLPTQPAQILLDLQQVRARFIHETEVFLEARLSTNLSTINWPRVRISRLCGTWSTPTIGSALPIL
jgi:hypothetical protein